jgi:hypothetical protein
MPQHTWHTDDDITEGLLNDLEARASAALPASSAAAVATTGAYADLTGKPALATVATTGAYADLTGKPALATVASTGAYADLTGKPTIPGGNPWQFRVEDYGAVGDNSTDDTTAIRAALAAAVTYATANNHYAEIIFQPKTYKLGGGLVQGGATQGNAQIPLPFIAGNVQKLTLVFKGSSDVANNHWNATTAQTTGTVLRSTLTGQAYSATYGMPSIIGSATPELSGYGAGGGFASAIFSNINVVVDGIQLQAPSNPSLNGWDFRGAACVRVVSGSAMSTDIPSSYSLTPDRFTSALLMPLPGNNDLSEVGQWTAFGWFCGIAISEHSHVESVRVIACTIGIRVLGAAAHAAIIEHASVESCASATLQYVDSAPVPYPNPGFRLVISLLDIEFSGDIYDPGGNLFGEVWVSNQWSNPGVTGATNLRIISLDTVPGVVTAPSIPATTVALKNPFWRDCAVTVTGGTVTAIAVNGVSLGITSGTVFVPSGKTITLTYSSAPTWHWVAL